MANDMLLPGGILSMTGLAAERLLAAGNGDAALLYLHMLRSNGVYDCAAAGKALKWDAARLFSAHNALVAMGLAQPGAAPAPAVSSDLPDEPPEYTADDIVKEMEDAQSSFPGLVREIQRRLGKPLSTADLKTLYTLYDFLALPAEVICLLVSFCVEDMERKYGPGHKPRMTQIRKEAFVWRRLGLDTAEAAEAHLKRQLQVRGREGDILAQVGIRDRAAVGRERDYIAAWVDMGFPDEVIRLAYERTIFQKHEFHWAYANSILRSWHQKGLHTPEEIKAKDSGRAAAVKAPADTKADAGAQNDRVAENARWMREFLARQKEGEG